MAKLAKINSDSGTKDPIIQRMLDFFKLSSEAESDNRKRGLEALEFRNGGQNQWDGNILQLRRSDNRPCETYNQIPQFVHQVTNDMRQNMAQTKFVPGEDADEEKAEILEDLVRNIQASSEGEVAYDMAADNQVTVGWGGWRYITDYENDKTFDQIIKVRWIPNIFTVYDDPFAMLQDRSDRRKLIEVCDIPVDDFNSDYSREYSSLDLSSIGDSAPQWASQDTVRVAEYWELTEEKTTLYRVGGKITKEKPAGEVKDEDQREVSVPKVMWYKCTAIEVLDRKEWPGIFIPYVIVTGEYLNIDGKQVLSGLVEHMMAAQKQYNYWSNSATEMVASAPRSPFILDPEQIEGYEKFWDQANIKNYPYLPARLRDSNQQPYPSPQRAQNGADIASMLQLVQQANQNLYQTSGIHQAGLGEPSNEKSGKAIIARQREGDVSTFHFPDNMARGQRFGGRILADLIPKIYDGARTIRGLKEDKTTREVKINQRYKDDAGQMKEHDLAKGCYDVMVTTGPNYTTKRQEAAETMTQLIQSAPQLMQLAGDLIVGNMDFPGAQELAERLKKTLPPGLADDPKQGDIPPQVQAQLQQAGQMVQELQQQLQLAQQEIQQQGQELASKQADVQAKQADLQIKAQTLQLNAQESQRKAQLDQMQMQLDSQDQLLKQRELALEEKKLELEGVKVQVSAVQAAQPQQAPGASASARPRPQIDPDGDMDSQMAAFKQADDEWKQGQMLLELHAQQQQEEAQAQKAAELHMQQTAMQAEAQDRANQQALMTALLAQLGSLQQTISAPKIVTRDPATGAIMGVVNAS